MKPIIGIGLTGARYAISKVGGKWMLNDYERRCQVQAFSWAGVDVWRRFLCSVWGVSRLEEIFCPWNLINSHWDLQSYNQEWFNITLREIEINNQYGIKTIISICTMNELDETLTIDGKKVYRSPWVNNLQGVKSFNEPAAWPYLKAFLNKFLTAAAGMNIGYEQGNENNKDYRFVNTAREAINPVLKAHGLAPWSLGATFKPYYDFKLYAPGRAIVKRFGFNGSDLIKDCQKVKATQEWYSQLTDNEKQTVSTIATAPTKSVWHELRKDLGAELEYKVFVMSHKCLAPGQTEFPAKYFSNSKNYGISDDGVFNGKGADTRPSGDEWEKMIGIVLTGTGSRWLEHCPENMDIEYQASVIAAMENAVYKKTGKHSKNYHKYPKPVKPVEPEPIPEPEPEPEPEPIPEPEYPKFKFTWQVIVGIISAMALVGMILSWTIK